MTLYQPKQSNIADSLLFYLSLQSESAVNSLLKFRWWCDETMVELYSLSLII